MDCMDRDDANSIASPQQQGERGGGHEGNCAMLLIITVVREKKNRLSTL